MRMLGWDEGARMGWGCWGGIGVPGRAGGRTSGCAGGGRGSGSGSGGRRGQAGSAAPRSGCPGSRPRTGRPRPRGSTGPRWHSHSSPGSPARTAPLGTSPGTCMGGRGGDTAPPRAEEAPGVAPSPKLRPSSSLHARLGKLEVPGLHGDLVPAAVGHGGPIPMCHIPTYLLPSLCPVPGFPLPVPLHLYLLPDPWTPTPKCPVPKCHIPLLPIPLAFQSPVSPFPRALNPPSPSSPSPPSLCIPSPQCPHNPCPTHPPPLHPPNTSVPHPRIPCSPTPCPVPPSLLSGEAGGTPALPAVGVTVAPVVAATLALAAGAKAPGGARHGADLPLQRSTRVSRGVGGTDPVWGGAQSSYRPSMGADAGAAAGGVADAPIPAGTGGGAGCPLRAGHLAAVGGEG